MSEQTQKVLLSEVMTDPKRYGELVEAIATNQIELHKERSGRGFTKEEFTYGDYSHSSIVNPFGRWEDEPEAQGRRQLCDDVDQKRKQLKKQNG